MKSMKSIISKLSLFCATIILIMVAQINVNAAEVTSNTIEPVTQATSTYTYDASNPGGLPSMSIEDFQDKAETKMYDLVKTAQIICEPLLIVFFIVCAIVTIVGFIGKGGVWKGLIGMLICASLFTCVMYAPEIVAMIRDWWIAK